jgi:hypothetical protein
VTVPPPSRRAETLEPSRRLTVPCQSTVVWAHVLDLDCPQGRFGVGAAVLPQPGIMSPYGRATPERAGARETTGMSELEPDPSTYLVVLDGGRVLLSLSAYCLAPAPRGVRASGSPECLVIFAI